MYTQSITRAHRTAFVLLLDQSGSMSEPIRFRGCETTKARALATITNELLFELIERARRTDGVRDYYDLTVLGYSGADEVHPLLPGGRRTIGVGELAQLSTPMRTESVEYRMPDGSVALRDIPAPAWIEPHAAGQTPMYEALCEAHELLEEWCARKTNAESFPPVVFNITDGEATDCNDEELRGAARRIRSLGTADGQVLLINVHIAAAPEGCSVFFPSEEEADCPNRYARLLYECSSPMPAIFEAAIREAKGPLAAGPFRGMSFNASAVELVAMLNIGSISVKTE